MTARILYPAPSPSTSTTLKVTTDPKKSSSTSMVVAILVFCAAAFVFAFLLYLFIKKICLRRYKFSVRDVGLRRFSLQEIEKATMGFSSDCVVGSGAFGKVYVGVFDVDTVLAIKRAHEDSFESILEFKNEVELLWRVKHPNLVSLVGYCQDDGQRMLIYEYVPNGSLLEYIAGTRRKPLTWRQRVNIAVGAAKGIAHLHDGVDPGIIHRDIKPSNILLGEGFEAKVSDFGLVRSGPVGDMSYVSSQIKGTPGYLDPHYCSSCHVTPLSDVYSFGVILLQLISARRAVDKSRPDTHAHIVDWARPSIEKGAVQEIMDANLLLEARNVDMDAMLKIGRLALRCVAKVPKNRPAMSQVVRELEEAFNGYIAPSNGKQKLDRRRRSFAGDESMSFSIDGVGLEKFDVEEADEVSVQSVTLRCLDVSEIDDDRIVDGGRDGELAGISEETDGSN